jgi:hypothetical protein
LGKVAKKRSKVGSLFLGLPFYLSPPGALHGQLLLVEKPAFIRLAFVFAGGSCGGFQNERQLTLISAVPVCAVESVAPIGYNPSQMHEEDERWENGKAL